jgi:hypothetical protein
MPYKLNPLTGGLDYYESGLPSQATHSGKYLTTDGSDASWAALAGGGDMAAATYDPTTVAGDAFDMDNMNDGSTNKVMTATQETNFETAYSHSQAAHGDADADNTASNETSHADVVVDGDFDSDGFLIRSGGAGSYSLIHPHTLHPTTTTQAHTNPLTLPLSGRSGGQYSRPEQRRQHGSERWMSYSVDTSTYSASDHNHDADYADIANEHAESHTVASHSDTSATGAELDELTDGSTTSLHSHAGGGGISEYMYPVWAEENAALGASNTYEWAFGNGANTPADGGVVIYVPSGWTAEVVAMSLSVGGGTATVELVHNGTPQGSSARVVLSTGQYATDELGTPLSLSNNDYINFRTSSSSSTSGPCVATAWIKMTET